MTRLAGDAVAGPIHAAHQAGAELGLAAKGAVIGTIKGVGEVTTVSVGVVSDTIRAAIKGTGKIGGDVNKGARSATEGALETTKSVGLKLEYTQL